MVLEDPGAVSSFAITLGLFFSFRLTLFGVYVNASIRDRFDRRHSVTQFGRGKTADYLIFQGG